MASITYEYPWIYSDEDSYKYGYRWSEETARFASWRVNYQMLNHPLPSCSEIALEVEVFSESTDYFDRTWNVWVYGQSSGWRGIATFEMPACQESGDAATPYTASYCAKFAVSPAQDILYITVTPEGRISGEGFTMSLGIEGAVITETVPEAALAERKRFCKVMENRGGTLSSYPKEIALRMGDSLVTATEVMVNIGGNLVTMPKMQEYPFCADSDEQSVMLRWEPQTSGRYTIDINEASGAETDNARAAFILFDDEMNEIRSVQSSASVYAEAGREYRILVISRPEDDGVRQARRLLKVYST